MFDYRRVYGKMKHVPNHRPNALLINFSSPRRIARDVPRLPALVPWLERPDVHTAVVTRLHQINHIMISLMPGIHHPCFTWDPPVFVETLDTFKTYPLGIVAVSIWAVDHPFPTLFPHLIRQNWAISHCGQTRIMFILLFTVGCIPCVSHIHSHPIRFITLNPKYSWVSSFPGFPIHFCSLPSGDFTSPLNMAYW